MSINSRVNVVRGKNPILIVVPHGAPNNDTNTDVVGSAIAKAVNCHAVINQGFERADDVDVDNDLADCNRISHVKQPVVYDEFLHPILKICGLQVLGHKNPITIFHIHGVGDRIHQEAGEPVGLILGWGLGSNKNSYSCSKWRKNLFVHIWRTNFASNGVGEIFEGKGGGKYAGKGPDNMNQYFRREQVHSNVSSMQLEIPFNMRSDEGIAKSMGLHLAGTILEYLKWNSFPNEPESKLL